MKKLLAITALAVMACSPALAATMASQPWVTNRIAEAEARVGAQISAATNAIPAPDYSTGNAQLVATIEATAPAPGNYAAVSNRAMSALQSHQSLAPSTNYTDAALGAYASTGVVARANVYGTPMLWTDATGCVWRVSRLLDRWDVANIGAPEDVEITWYGPEWVIETDDFLYPDIGWYVSSPTRTPDFLGNNPNAMTLTLDWVPYEYTEGYLVHTVFSRPIVTNLVGRVALTNDIPDVTAAIREHSLGGIWDRDLEVWWTPIMENGALRYIATTNVNLNAGN